MSQDNATDWAAIRHRYETTQDAVADICNDCAVDTRDFNNRRKREKWRRANPRPFPPPRAGAKTKPPHDAALETSHDNDGPKTGAVGSSDAGPALLEAKGPQGAGSSQRRKLLDRLVSAIEMKLEQLERRMTKDLASDDDTPATDHERETRAIGALIDNLEKITEMETGVASSSRTRSSAPADADLADEAERCRRELAERLSRIVEAAGRNA
ncbi:MAG: hypothetical protein R3D67_04145 [Hyphomicrobiaceae bacterium]